MLEFPEIRRARTPEGWVGANLIGELAKPEGLGLTRFPRGHPLAMYTS